MLKRKKSDSQVTEVTQGYKLENFINGHWYPDAEGNYHYFLDIAKPNNLLDKKFGYYKKVDDNLFIHLEYDLAKQT